MAELFEKTPQNITMHIGNAYKEGELERDSTCKEYLQVQQEGKRKVSRIVKYYDLDVIISVGYRNGLRKKFGGSALFGNEKDESFKSSIGQIYQTDDITIKNHLKNTERNTSKTPNEIPQKYRTKCIKKHEFPLQSNYLHYLCS